MKGPRATLIALAAVLFFWNLWAYDLWAPDEPYFAEGAREMIADGRWAVPHVNGVVTTDKPPLFFWSIALLSLPTGEVTSLTARLPSALAALGTLALTLLLGRRLVGERAALIGGATLVTMELFWNQARSSQIDALLCFLEMAALTAFVLYRAGDLEGRRAGIAFWAACALAVLAKGPVGVLVPVGVVVTVLAWDRRLRALRGFAPLAGPALFVGLVAGWIVLATIGGGGEYSVWGALREHALDRAVEGMHHAQPPWYFLTSMPLRLLPWTLLVPAALLLAWRRRRDDGHRFLLVAAAFVVAFFSIPTEKRGLYVLLAFPPLALLIGAAVDAAGRGVDGLRRRWLTLPLAAQAGLLAAAGLAAPAFRLAGRDLAAELARRGGLDPSLAGDLGLAVLAGSFVLVAGGVATLLAAARGHALQAAVLTAGTAAALYLAAVTLAYPALDPARSARALAEDLRERTRASREAGHPVAAFRTGNIPEPVAFYSDGVYTREIQKGRLLREHLKSPAEVWIVARRDALEELAPDLRALIEVVATHRVSRREYVLGRNRTIMPRETPRRP